MSRVKPLTLAIAVVCACSALIPLARNIILQFLLVELASIVLAYLVAITLLPVLFPARVKPERVFTGGTAKPPYIHPEEVYRPTTPLKATEERGSA